MQISPDNSVYTLTIGIWRVIRKYATNVRLSLEARIMPRGYLVYFLWNTDIRLAHCVSKEEYSIFEFGAYRKYWYIIVFIITFNSAMKCFQLFSIQLYFFNVKNISEIRTKLDINTGFSISRSMCSEIITNLCRLLKSVQTWQKSIEMCLYLFLCDSEMFPRLNRKKWK